MDNVQIKATRVANTIYMLEGVGGIERPTLRVITFEDAIAIHINGEKVMMRYTGPGHTDGDSIVVVTSSKVVLMGESLYRLSVLLHSNLDES